ncbi:MAG: hypothetical protein J6P93_04225 [Alphaproteobacteria bacterium]|nr:hypothetical protein [Alphaproteobacteria bacterium]
MGLRSWFAGKLNNAFNPKLSAKKQEAPKEETAEEKARKSIENMFDSDEWAIQEARMYAESGGNFGTPLPYDYKPKVEKGSGFLHDLDEMGKDIFGEFGYKTEDEKRQKKAEEQFKEEVKAIDAIEREVAEKEKNEKTMPSAGDYFAKIEKSRNEEQKQEAAAKGTSSLKQTLATAQVEGKTETKTNTDNKTVDPRIAKELIGRGK